MSTRPTSRPRSSWPPIVPIPPRSQDSPAVDDRVVHQALKDKES